MQAANTILEQLGGFRFIAMTGAKDLVGSDKSLQFRIGKGAINKATNVRITLDPSDLYTVEFFSIRGVNVKQISSHEFVPAENLCSTFTAQTGMDTHL